MGVKRKMGSRVQRSKVQRFRGIAQFGLLNYTSNPPNQRRTRIENSYRTSFRRKPESSYFNEFWTPAFAGVTVSETFYETVKYTSKIGIRKSKINLGLWGISSALV